MRERRRTLAGGLIAALVPITLLTACGSQESSGTTTNADGDVTVRIGTQPGAQLVYGDVYIALENGYFEDEGIDLKLQTYTSGPLALTAIASGDLQGAMAAWLPHVQAFAQGTPMQVVMSLAKNNTTLVGGADVSSIEDLDGKKVGSPGIGTIHDIALTRLAEENGIEIQHVPAAITDLPVMLRKGEIAAFIGWETVTSQAVLTVDGAHFLSRLPFPGNENLELALGSELIDSEPEVAQKVVNAAYRGSVYAKACPDQFKAKITEVMNVPDAKAIVDSAFKNVDVTEPELDSETAGLWYDFDVKAGQLKIPDGKWASYDDFEADIWNPDLLAGAVEEYGDWKPEC